MKREEAITVLNMVEAHGPLVIEAKKMAIEALKQPEIIRCRDCIHGDSENLMQIGDKFFAMYRCERSHILEKGMFYCGHAIRREEGEQCQPKE